MTTPYFAAAAAAANSRQHQMPAALSIFPTYQGNKPIIQLKQKFLNCPYKTKCKKN
jgi:hypothetical protein